MQKIEIGDIKHSGNSWKSDILELFIWSFKCLGYIALILAALGFFIYDECVYLNTKGKVTSVAFNPNSAFLAMGLDDGTVVIWDAETAKYQKSLEGHGGSISDLIYRADGKILVSSGLDRRIIGWDPVTGEKPMILIAKTPGVINGMVKAVCWNSTNDMLASANCNHTITLWNTVSGKQNVTLMGHIGWVNDIVFSPDNRTLYSTSNDATIRAWDVLRGTQKFAFNNSEGWLSDLGLSSFGRALALSSSGRILAVGVNQDITLWNPYTRQIISQLKGHTGEVTSLKFSPDEKMLVSASSDKTLILWDMGTMMQLKRLSGHTAPVNCIDINPTGSLLASGGDDRKVILWDITTGESLRHLYRPEGHWHRLFKCLRLDLTTRLGSE